MLVDLLGSLLPGTLLLIISIFSLLSPTVALVHSLSSNLSEKRPHMSSMFFNFLEKTTDTPNTIWLFTSLIFFMAAYLIGFLLFRRDPAEPDQASVQYLIKEEEKSRKKMYGKGNPDTDEKFLEEFAEWKKCSLACEGPESCSFPYPYLKKYLSTRGHGQLAALVDWNGEEPYQSKTFINRIKISLKFFFPVESRTLIRNEAHVRLASSGWYAAKTLIKICFVGFVLSVISMMIAGYRGSIMTNSGYLAWLIGTMKWPAAMALIAVYCRVSIEKFIHYQRLREIVFVLQLYQIGACLNKDLPGLSSR